MIYNGWYAFSKKVSARSQGVTRPSESNDRGERVEVIYTNRPTVQGDLFSNHQTT